MGSLDEGKKRHPISKIPLSGPSCEEFPLLSSSCGPLLSSSLLFFFNQAVWGCQVFWDEDSQPCEKLIPCGPSSQWRSSPWEHWWWLAGRWCWAEGGGREEGWMEGWRVGWTQGHPDQRIEWHRLSNSSTRTRPTPEHIVCLAPPKHPYSVSTQYALSTIHPICVNPWDQGLLRRSPAWPTDGWNGEQRGFVAWRACRVASEGWQWFTMERVLLLHCVSNLPSTASTPNPSCSHLASIAPL